MNYDKMTMTELKILAKERGFTSYNNLKKDELIKNHTDFDELEKECGEAIDKIQPHHYANYFKYGYKKETYPKRKKPWKSSHRRQPKSYKQ